MAAGLGFKTFVTGDVLTAADTNGYLMQGVLVFATAAARDSAITSPQEGQTCYLKDTDAVMTYSGAAWVAVGGGMTLLSTTALGTTTTTVTGIVGTYNKLFVEVIDCFPGTDGSLNLRFNTDATANAYQGVYNYYPSDATSGTQRAPFIQKDTSYYLCFGTVDNADNNNYSSFEIQNYASSTVKKTLTSGSVYTNSAGNVTVDVSGGAWLNVAAITSLSIIGAGAFSGGSIKIWGIK